MASIIVLVYPAVECPKFPAGNDLDQELAKERHTGLYSALFLD